MGKDAKLDRASLVKEVRKMNEKAAKKRGKAEQERERRLKELQSRLANARAELRAARQRKEADAAQSVATRVVELEEQIASEERASEGGVKEALRGLDTAREAARKEAEAAGRRQRERQRRRRRAELIESAGKPARHPQAFQVRQNARNAIARENALLLEPTESRFRFRDVGPNPPKWAPPSHVPAMKPADLSSCSNEYRAYVERQMRIRQEREEREAKEEARQANQPRERMVEERARVLHRSLPAPLGRSPTPNGREGTYAPPQRAISAQWRAGAVSDRDISPHRTFLDGPAQPSASTVLPPRLSFLEQRAERFGFDPTGALARRRQAVEALDAGGMEVSGLGSTASGVGEDASQAL